jgi:hypothetical protein
MSRYGVFRSVRAPDCATGTRPRTHSPDLEAAIRSGRMIDEDEFGLRPGSRPHRETPSLKLLPSMRVNQPDIQGSFS